MTTPLLMNRTQAARYLGVAPKTLDRLRKAGTVKGVFLDGMSREMYSTDALKRIVEEKGTEQ